MHLIKLITTSRQFRSYTSLDAFFYQIIKKASNKNVNSSNVEFSTKAFTKSLSRKQKQLHSITNDLNGIADKKIFSNLAYHNYKPFSKKKKIKKNISELGEVLFGIHPVYLALLSNKRECYKLFLKDDFMSLSNKHFGNKISELIKQNNVPVEMVPKETLDLLANNRPHQGACMDVSVKYYVEESSLVFKKIMDLQTENRPLFLLLDSVQDPMNFGAILRSSYFLGVDQVFATSECCRLSPTVSKASSGALERMDIIQLKSPLEFLTTLRNANWSILGSGTTENTQNFNIESIKTYSTDKPAILIIGNEATGISNSYLEMCDYLLKIPSCLKAADEFDSLNVSVATSIILYQLLKDK